MAWGVHPCARGTTESPSLSIKPRLVICQTDTWSLPSPAGSGSVRCGHQPVPTAYTRLRHHSDLYSPFSFIPTPLGIDPNGKRLGNPWVQVVEKALVTQGGGLPLRPESNHGAVGSCVHRENPNYFKLMLVCLTESAHLVTAVTGARGPVSLERPVALGGWEQTGTYSRSGLSM